MNPIVFTILAWEKALEIQRQAHRPLWDDLETAPRSRRKKRKGASQQRRDEAPKATCIERRQAWESSL